MNGSGSLDQKDTKNRSVREEAEDEAKAKTTIQTKGKDQDRVLRFGSGFWKDLKNVSYIALEIGSYYIYLQRQARTKMGYSTQTRVA